MNRRSFTEPNLGVATMPDRKGRGEGKGGAGVAVMATLALPLRFVP